LDEKKKAVLNEMLDKLGRVADDTTSVQNTEMILRGGTGARDDIRFKGVDTIAENPALKEKLRKEQGRFVISTSMDEKVNGKIAASQIAGMKKRLNAPPTPNSAKVRSGFNERFALDSTKPENLFVVNRVAREWKKSRELWDAVSSFGHNIPAGSPVPKGFRRVPGEAINKFYESFDEFVNVDAPLIFDDPQVIRQFKQSVSEHMNGIKPDGNFVIPESLYKRFMKELDPPMKIPGLDQMTAAWRMSVVSALRPAFLVNNFLGQTALLAIAHTNFKGFRSLVQYATSPALRKELRQGAGALEGSGQASVLARQTSELAGASKVGQKIGTASDAIGRFGQALTDDPFRRMAFAGEVLPTARKLMKQHKGDPDYTIHNAVQEVLADPKTMDRIERKVLDDLVDFDDLSRTERELVRRVLPFYSWTKGSGKIMVNLLMDRPLAVNVGVNLGLQYQEDLEKEFGGEIPDYVKGAIPFGKREGSQQKIWSTNAINPFVTPADTLSQGIQLATGGPSSIQPGPDNALSGANPVIKGVLGAFGMPDPFTGRRQEPGLKGFAQGFANSLPQVQGLARSYPKTRMIGDPTLTDDDLKEMKANQLFRSSPRSEALKYLGIPYRNLNVDKAVEIGDKKKLFEFTEIPSELKNKDGEQAAEYTPVTINGKQYLVRTSLLDKSKLKSSKEKKKEADALFKKLMS
jgi:hypothetical protein